MSELLNLTRFEQFDLWLDVLLQHQRRLGAPSQIVRSLEPDQDHMPCLNATTEILERLLTFCTNFNELLLEELQESESSSLAVNPTANESMRHHRDCSESLKQMEELQDALTHGKRLAETLTRADSLSQQEFDSLSFFICSVIEAFRQTPGYSLLSRYTHHWNRLHSMRNTVQKLTEDDMLRSRLELVLDQLLYLLGLLRYIRPLAIQNFQSQQALWLMVNCYYRCRRTFLSMDDLSRLMKERHPELAEKISFSASTLKMEATNALKRELGQLDSEADQENVGDRLDQATGYLQSGFDQGVEHLLNSLDPDLDTTLIFGDPVRAYREAATLLERLTGLHKTIKELESQDQPNLETFDEEIRAFRKSGLASLYRRDQRTFDSFCEELHESEAQGQQFILHRFYVFLTTLLSLVKNRTALTHETEHDSGASEVSA